MIAVDRGEIRRYLGYRAPQAPNGQIEQAISRCLAALERSAEPKSVYRSFPLAHSGENLLELEDVMIESRSLARNLRGCERVYLMAATLGIGVDRLIARACAVRISDAVIYQAAAAALIEAYCDEVNDGLRKRAGAEGGYCRPRFSPGYGDFSIAHQRDITRLLDTPRRIGLTVTDSLLLAPVKSVTAVIGIADTPQPCHLRGCEQCEKTDCAFRR